MKLAFFLGCVMPHRYPGVEAAIRQVLPELGVEILDIDGATCCPAPGVFGSFHKPTWLAVGARNLALVEEMGVDVFTACNGCFGTLYDVNHELRHNPQVLDEVNQVLSEETGHEYHGNVEVKNFISLLKDEIGPEKIAEMVEHPLTDFRVAVHLGCHWTRPVKIKEQGNPEDYTIIDSVVEAMGAQVVRYKDELKCCGAGGGVRTANKELSLQFTLAKLRNIAQTSANCIGEFCPFCHLQFDLGQREVKEIFGEEYSYPVFHVAQMLGLTIGMTLEEVGATRHFTPVKPDDLGL